jgi:hypothetical protein
MYQGIFKFLTFLSFALNASYWSSITNNYIIPPNHSAQSPPTLSAPTGVMCLENSISTKVNESIHETPSWIQKHMIMAPPLGIKLCFRIHRHMRQAGTPTNLAYKFFTTDVGSISCLFGNINRFYEQCSRSFKCEKNWKRRFLTF